MATIADILTDAFERVRDGVESVLDGISPEGLHWRAGPDANTVAWLVWHLTRVQDDHLAAAFEGQQAWLGDRWAERFALPFEPEATGYGHDPQQVARVTPNAALLRGYHGDVARRTAEWLGALSDAELDRVVDRRWDPPVTLGVRLVSVIGDCLQHVGQAAYVRGLFEAGGPRPVAGGR